jgi:hypothetical protein
MSSVEGRYREDFINARAMEKNAVMVQKDCQSHIGGKMDPMALNRQLLYMLLFLEREF